MIVTTTNTVEGHEIREYRGIVFGEVITGINVFKDIGAGLRNFFGGRSAGYEEELMNARNAALDEMMPARRAHRRLTPSSAWTWTTRSSVPTTECSWSASPAPPSSPTEHA